MSKLIGLVGTIGSGKDTIGKYLIDEYGFEKYAMANPLKEIVSIITGTPLDIIDGSSNREFREVVKHPDYNMTHRELLQYIGTEVFRDHFDKDIWVKIAKRRLAKTGDKVVVTDIRFPNEAEMIRDMGGEIWVIRRSLITNNNHISEKLTSIEGDIIIDNNSTLENLFDTIDSLM
jgi:dephospho-CoA kinase